MKTIWKFKLEVTDVQRIEMPKGANILTIQTQNDEPMVWALVDTDAPKESISFFIAGTGEPLTSHIWLMKHLGTFQMKNGSLVFHVFI